MPRIVEHIDKIARDTGRDVLFLEFHPLLKEGEGFFPSEMFDYKNCKERKQVIKWLEENNIKFTPCFNMAERGGVLIDGAYQGELYVDILFDENDPEYMKVNSYFENPDGSMKIKDVRFMSLSLEIAMRYKHHDEPGFWDDF